MIARKRIQRESKEAAGPERCMPVSIVFSWNSYGIAVSASSLLSMVVIKMQDLASVCRQGLAAARIAMNPMKSSKVNLKRKSARILKRAPARKAATTRVGVGDSAAREPKPRDHQQGFKFRTWQAHDGGFFGLYGIYGG
jgi:hypothetical protein